MISRFQISDFRGIRECTIEGLSKFNIFIGQNACGKTTVLEAISAASNPGAAGWLAALSSWRDFPNPSPGSDYSLRTYFYGLNLNVRPTLRYHTEKGEFRFVVTAIPAQLVPITQSDESSSTGTSSSLGDRFELGGVKLQFIDEKGKHYEGRIQITTAGGPHLNFSSQGFAFGPPPAQSVPIPFQGLVAFHIHARRSTSVGETANIITELYETRRESILISALQAVDPRVIQLQPGVRGNQVLLLVDIGSEKLLPMNSLGDGLCRMTLILSGLLHPTAKLLIVDDIDSGFHYTTMKHIWPAMQRANSVLNHQVFCTTHSEEMLEYARDAFSDCPNDVAVFRLERMPDDHLRVHRYSHEMLDTAISSLLEVR